MDPVVCSQLHSASFLVTVRSDVLSDSDGQGRTKIRKASSLIFKENKCIWEKTINEKESSPMSICHHILSCSKELKRWRNIKNVYFFSRKRTVWREKNCERYSEYLSEYRVASTWHLLLVPTVLELSCFHQMELPWRIIKVKHKTFSLLTAILLYSRGKKKGFGILRWQNYENRTKA